MVFQGIERFKKIWNHPNNFNIKCVTHIQFNVKWSRKDGSLDQLVVDTGNTKFVRSTEKDNFFECEFFIENKMEVPVLGMNNRFYEKIKSIELLKNLTF